MGPFPHALDPWLSVPILPDGPLPLYFPPPSCHCLPGFYHFAAYFPRVSPGFRRNFFFRLQEPFFCSAQVLLVFRAPALPFLIRFRWTFAFSSFFSFHLPVQVPFFLLFRFLAPCFSRLVLGLFRSPILLLLFPEFFFFPSFWPPDSFGCLYVASIQSFFSSPFFPLLQILHSNTAVVNLCPRLYLLSRRCRKTSSCPLPSPPENVSPTHPTSRVALSTFRRFPLRCPPMHFVPGADPFFCILTYFRDPSDCATLAFPLSCSVLGPGIMFVLDRPSIVFSEFWMRVSPPFFFPSHGRGCRSHFFFFGFVGATFFRHVFPPRFFPLRASSISVGSQAGAPFPYLCKHFHVLYDIFSSLSRHPACPPAPVFSSTPPISL